MGMAPSEIDACSIWQFQAAADGYRRAHMSDEERAKELSADEIKDLSEWVVSDGR